jgi:hypothetical protein
MGGPGASKRNPESIPNTIWILAAFGNHQETSMHPRMHSEFSENPEGIQNVFWIQLVFRRLPESLLIPLEINQSVV